ncbi:RNA polymerase sigma factor [Rhodocista pekingensis]|uniref:RNA polymerase sigma factor n=1 Tax=Rhodocista pekingensis TaxID=201185 RepID=A0ABW2KPN9_9PROT
MKSPAAVRTLSTGDPGRHRGQPVLTVAQVSSTPENTTRSESDEALVGRVAAGDRAAYAELVARHLDRTVTVAVRVLGSRAAAEDVAQEAFLRLWQSADRFRPEAARFSTWFYRITVNLCLDARRRPVHDDLESADEPADPAEDAVTRIERRQTAEAVARAVQDLPERQRAAVSLTYDLGLSNAEAATSLGIGVKAFEALLVRARRALRERLTGGGGESGTDGTEGGRT